VSIIQSFLLLTSWLEIAELLSRLQFTPTQLQDLFNALADIATGLNKHTHPTSDNEAYDLINADDVPQDVSSEGTGNEATEATSHSPTTAAPSTVAAESVIASPFAASKGESDTASVPEAPVVSVAPTVDAPVGTTVMAASPATAVPVSIAAPAAASTTRVFNGVSYQYPANGSSGPFYLVTRGRDVGVFVGWFVFFVFVDTVANF
jgi:hypothetical protein